MNADIIVVTCPSCGLSKTVPFRNLPRKPVQASCPKCKHSFVLHGHLHPPMVAADSEESPTTSAPREHALPPVPPAANAPDTQDRPATGVTVPPAKAARRLPPKEYRMTLIVRILTAITLFPLGLLFSAAALDKNPPDGALLCSGGALLLGTIVIWVHHCTKKIAFYPDRIEACSILGTTTVCLNASTCITRDKKRDATAAVAGMYFGALGGLVLGIIRWAAEKGSGDTTGHVYIVVSDGKKRIKLNSNVKGVNDIVEKLDEFELNVILPSLMAQYKKGDKISFGPVSLHNGQMMARNNSIRVAHITDLEVRDGNLFVQQWNSKQPFAKFKTSAIPNINSLIALASKRGEAAAEQVAQPTSPPPRPRNEAPPSVARRDDAPGTQWDNSGTAASRAPYVPAPRPMRPTTPFAPEESGFGRQAARASSIIPLIVFGASTIGKSAFEGEGALIAGGVVIALLAAGIILGIIGLCSKSEGNFARSIIGIGLNSVMLYVIVNVALTELTPEKKLLSLSTQINKTLPKEIEPGVRFDKTAVGPEKNFTYSYTLLKMKSMELDAERFKAAAAPQLQKEVCADKTLRPLLEKGATVTFSYNGNEGLAVADITIASSDCGK